MKTLWKIHYYSYSSLKRKYLAFFWFIISDTFTFFIIGLLVCQVFLFSLANNGFSNNFLDWNNCFVYHIPIFIDLKSRPFILFLLFQHTGAEHYNVTFVLFYTFPPKRQSTFPSYDVIGRNIWKITKVPPYCQLWARKELNGLDFILFNNLHHFLL